MANLSLAWRAVTIAAIAELLFWLTSKITPLPPSARKAFRQLRPKHSWDNVVRVLNRRGHDWTV
ncbi:hypothetical protein ACC754_44615, partial [Rhizobium johnstonii]